MKHKKEEVEAVVSSGNIFADLGYSDPIEAQVKSDLAMKIYQEIKNRNLTQNEAAEILGIDQPKVSDIIRGKLSKYSFERLFRFLTLMGYDTEIHVKKPQNRSSTPTIRVRNSLKRRKRIPA